MFKLAIVGLGPAGMFTLASLPDTHLPDTLLLESASIGGDLATQYSSVVANITKSGIINIIRSIPRWTNDAGAELSDYQDTDTPPLSAVVRMFRRLSLPDIQKAHFHTCTLTRLLQGTSPSRSEAPTGDGWTLITTAGSYVAKKVILCLGATPKVLDLPCPSIPLSIAFTPTLAHFISPTDTIVVFGTSHSGALVLKNLKTLGCTSVYAVYKGAEPFNSGADGLQHDALVIAKEIQAKAWGPCTPTLISYNDFAALHRIVSKAHAVVYAIGFEPRTIPCMDTSGQQLSTPSVQHNLYTFGYGAKTGTHAPVGFSVFLNEIMQALPAILS